MLFVGIIFLVAIFASQLSHACNGGCSKGCMCGGDCGSSSACHGFSLKCYCLAIAKMTAQQRILHDMITNSCSISQNITTPIVFSIFNRDNQGFMIRCRNGPIGGYIM